MCISRAFVHVPKLGQALKMTTNQITRTAKSVSGKVLLAFALVFALNVPQAWAGQSQDCTAFGDASSVCAPISQLAMTLGDGTAVSVSGGAAALPVSATSLKFVFTSNSANATKNLYLQFFDISQGLSLTLPTPKCSSAQIAGHGCVTALDSNGSVTIPVTVSGMGVGKVFKYQLNGPAGFTSGFVTTTYTSSGNAGSTPETCGGDATFICSPITRLTMKTGGNNVPVTYDAATHDGTAYITQSTSSLDYKFTFPSDYVNKYIMVNFFDVTNLNLAVSGDAVNSSTTCDPQPAATGTCKIEIDANGVATFSTTLSNNTSGANFKYKIVGPNFDSNVVVVTIGSAPSASPSPTPTVPGLPVSASVTAGKGKGKFTIAINNASGRIAQVTYSIGTKAKHAALRIANNKSVFVISAAKGSYRVQVSIGIFKITKTVLVK